MKKYIRAGIQYVEDRLVCDECHEPVDFAGTPENMFLQHRDPRHDTHEPYIEAEELLIDARDALFDAEMDRVNDLIRAYVALESMTFDNAIAINVYQRALQVVSEED